MQRYIAFLRAINVGGHTVTMDHLRTLMAGLGLKNVETFIASGNVIFDAAASNARALEKRVEGHLEQSLGYPVATFIRSAAELEAVVNHRAFPEADLAGAGASLYILFLHEPPTDEVREKVLALRTERDDFHVHNREVYWLSRGKISESPLFSRGTVDKAIGVPATSRNVTTLKKLVAKYPAG